MPRLQPATLALLDDLERRIDPEVEDDLAAQWLRFLRGDFDGVIFAPERKRRAPPNVPLPRIAINDALDDLELMLARQFAQASAQLDTPDLLPSVRADYGTGILSSIFGAELFIMPRAMDTLPTTRALADEARIRAIAEGDVPDVLGGLGLRVFEAGELYAEVLARYPKMAKYVFVYHPDAQGPLDIAELLWGGGMFYAMYDEPELVHALLRRVVQAYGALMDRWFRLFPSAGEYSAHWGTLMHGGKILLRDDSAMNLSPALYRAFALPYDAQLLAEYGGGAIHFCGRGDHYIRDMAAIPHLTGINMSQPHLNDMETIYQNTVDRGIPLLGFSRARALADAGREGAFHGRMHAR